ncbi:CinA family protein [Marinihelvus fidelis]|uniref:CinA family protein n=1 Tax=Marinihelvus fidelis TaxID=2613842 RepID=A0A5N0TAB1_9GAMM|nr:CinA family protein [Marinihelvus fidelis]KAA9131902.1 CinA family protein [Marinihelvus fidelis]
MNDTALAELEQRAARGAAAVADALRARGWTLCTAESCTGGWLAKVCTDLPGSSDWFHGGYVSYAYRAKEQQLGVIHDDLVEHGAVSEAIASQMALGARRGSGADIVVSMTGIAGPGGGLPSKPVGLVCLGWSIKGGNIITATRHFDGDRAAVRLKTVCAALEGTIEALEEGA